MAATLEQPLVDKDVEDGLAYSTPRGSGPGPEEDAKTLEEWRDWQYWGSYLTLISISFAGFVDYSVIMPSAQA